MRRIITIGREFGSGGRELGRRLAQELNIAYYDQEIILEISKRSSLSEQYVSQILEGEIINLPPITIGRSFYHPMKDPTFELKQSIYQQQSKIILEMAENSNCVIVGRCADYILKDYNPFKFFVYADMDSRIKRCREKASEEEHLSDKELKRHIIDIDSKRAKYYKFYTGQLWGDKLNYDFCINTSKTEIKEIVSVLVKLF